MYQSLMIPILFLRKRFILAMENIRPLCLPVPDMINQGIHSLDGTEKILSRPCFVANVYSWEHPSLTNICRHQQYLTSKYNALCACSEVYLRHSSTIPKESQSEHSTTPCQSRLDSYDFLYCTF